MRQIAILLSGLTAIALLVLAGCGSDSAATKQQQQKTATIVFSLPSDITTPIMGAQIKMLLPAGVTISDISSSLKGKSSTGQLVAPNLTSVPPAVSFEVWPVAGTNNPISTGIIAELTCDVTSGTTLDQSSFAIVAGDAKMFSNSNGTSMLLDLPVTLSVSFGY